MKDLIENRSRLRPGEKLRIGVAVLRANGPVWTALLGVYYLSSAVADRAFSWMDARRRKKGLPGLNSPELNRLIWDKWDWSGRGEEWTPSPEWKEAVVAGILDPNVPPGARILEIGPGGGRWTEALIRRGSSLVGIDISASCVEECRRRFKGADRVEFRVGSGADLAGIADGSVDAIWSYDVFVHINRPELASYAGEFHRVLAPGGVGIVHHGTLAGARGGWRSDVTGEDVREILAVAGLEVVSQFQKWEHRGRSFDAGLYEDAVTIFRKPDAARAESSAG